MPSGQIRVIRVIDFKSALGLTELSVTERAAGAAMPRSACGLLYA